MSDRIHSFGGLGKAIQEEALKIALKCCSQGDNDNAVEAFDLIKDLSSLEMSVKSKCREVYCTKGKHLQHLWRLQEVRHCFERARETDLNDTVPLSRKKLLETYHAYRTLDNIGQFT